MPVSQFMGLSAPFPLSALGGGEGWGEVGDSRALACAPRPSRPHAGETPAVRARTHLTLPSLRDGPLPLPPEGRRGEFPTRRRLTPHTCSISMRVPQKSLG